MSLPKLKKNLRCLLLAFLRLRSGVMKSEAKKEENSFGKISE